MIAVALLLLPFSAASGAAVPGAVGKVVKLLTDMQTQLEDDKKADEEMYEKLSCWCKVNGEGKGTAVEIATAKVADLNSRIGSLTAKSSELEEAIKTVESEVRRTRRRWTRRRACGRRLCRNSVTTRRTCL